MRNSSNLALIIIFLYTVVSVIGVIAISSNMSEEGNRVAIATFVIQYVWDFFINQTIKTGLNYYMFKNYRNIETRFIRKLLVLLIDRNFYDPRVSLSRL